MQRTMKKVLAVALSMVVVVAMSAMLPGGQAAAKSKKMKMPTKVTSYYKDGGKWVKIATRTLKYNKKGDLIRFTEPLDGGETFKIKYKYKKRKKVKATVTSKYSKATMKFKKGRLVYVKTHDLEEDAYSTDTYKYKKGYLTSDSWTNTNDEYLVHKGAYKYTTTFGGGGKVTVKYTGKDFYGDVRNYTRVFNKKGLLISSKSTASHSTYTYKYKGKLVTERIEKIVDESDGSVSEQKVVYKYGKRKAPAARYYKYVNGDERTVLGNL